MILRIISINILALLFIGCSSNTEEIKEKNMTKKSITEESTNPLLCDIETGMCETASDELENDSIDLNSAKKAIKIVYFTDPICSSCWGIEPQLRKLKLEYGHSIEIEYRMGGLLKDWNYNSGGISKPSDVAEHWDEVSAYYDMPIDGDLWLEDPLNSSYPPSIAFKAAQMQDNDKAILFLREIREMVFLQKKNITKWEFVEAAANKVGLDSDQLKKDLENEAIRQFENDLKLAKDYGVRGFPTMFFVGNNGNSDTVYGFREYEVYEKAFLKIAPTVVKNKYEKTYEALFSKFSTLTAKEFSVLSESPREESENVLNELTKQGTLNKFETKNGAIWSMK